MQKVNSQRVTRVRTRLRQAIHLSATFVLKTYVIAPEILVYTIRYRMLFAKEAIDYFI